MRKRKRTSKKLRVLLLTIGGCMFVIGIGLLAASVAIGHATLRVAGAAYLLISLVLLAVRFLWMEIRASREPTGGV